MVEYHGWININDNAYEADTETTEEIVKKLDKELKDIFFDGRIMDLRNINGSYILMTSGVTNHKSQDVFEVIDLFKHIAEKAPGSYGLLYINDDEDPNSNEDNFQVLKIAKGEWSIHKDTLLSPCSEVIFDD